MNEAAIPPNPPRNGEGDRAKRGGGGAERQRRPTVYRARKLRREMTLPEVLLWQHLRGRPNGLKFRRQHPIDPYVADFFCREVSLVVEIDGAMHDEKRQEQDKLRDAGLREKGLQVLRIPAQAVLSDAASTAEWILARAGNPLHQPPPSASAGPPPRPGEE